MLNNRYNIVAIILCLIIGLYTITIGFYLPLIIALILTSYVFAFKYAWMSFFVYPLFAIAGLVGLSFKLIIYLFFAFLSRDLINKTITGKQFHFYKATEEINTRFRNYFMIIILFQLVYNFILTGFSFAQFTSIISIVYLISYSALFVGSYMVVNLFAGGIYYIMLNLFITAATITFVTTSLLFSFGYILLFALAIVFYLKYKTDI